MAVFLPFVVFGALATIRAQKWGFGKVFAFRCGYMPPPPPPPPSAPQVGTGAAEPAIVLWEPMTRRWPVQPGVSWVTGTSGGALQAASVTSKQKATTVGWMTRIICWGSRGADLP